MREKLETCPSNVTPNLPPIGEVRRQLARIVASTVLRDLLRLTHFLTFVVETTLAGDGDRIKAYTIAVGALGRSSDFDPQADPIVRVEAGRLRQALSRYYADVGRDDELVIELPRGTYVPTFSVRDTHGRTPPAASQQPRVGPRPTSRDANQRARSRAAPHHRGIPSAHGNSPRPARRRQSGNRERAANALVFARVAAHRP